MTPRVVMYEDRPAALVGVQLAVASLARHWPAATVAVTAPGAPDWFGEWLAAQPNATPEPSPAAAGLGWDAKPTVLLDALASDGTPVLWLDADVVVCGDLGSLLAAQPAGALVAAEETAYGQAQGGTHRTAAWGLPVGRALPTTVNTGLLLVDRTHRPLLEAWRELLADPRYRAAQTAPWWERPLHLLGDQEVLTALLGSEEFATVELALIRRGTDIAQCFGPAGFTPRERLRARGLPVLVHAMGVKPWNPPEPTASDGLAGLRARYDRAHLELAPYAWVARQYRREVPGVTAWADRAHGTARVCRALTHDDPVRRELPLALVDAGVRSVRRWAGVARYAVGGER